MIVFIQNDVNIAIRNSVMILSCSDIHQNSLGEWLHTDWTELGGG